MACLRLQQRWPAQLGYATALEQSDIERLRKGTARKQWHTLPPERAVSDSRAARRHCATCPRLLSVTPTA